MVYALCFNIIFNRLQKKLHDKYNLLSAELCVIVTKVAVSKGSQKGKRSSPRL